LWAETRNSDGDDEVPSRKVQAEAAHAESNLKLDEVISRKVQAEAAHAESNLKLDEVISRKVQAEAAHAESNLIRIINVNTVARLIIIDGSDSESMITIAILNR
jgi:hypothetical protein